ncbi:hypothetical protein Pth03_11430 [Planotetraspora thailandica]|uniref:Tryptophan 2,3-dioxygenase n=2 Tax=Planotetraspora thailandica TaxID=487172 RepID=A0A8J3V2C0_9ACTN|nr:hypothetical protein Pth03_11430 [Planotetraspora thailandica]
MIAAEAAIVDSGRLGVGGANLQANTSDAAQRSGAAAYDAVAGWQSEATPLGHTRLFPYEETLLHFQAVGRLRANPMLVSLLRGIHSDRVGWPPVLREWLPLTYDQREGDYDSYIGSRALAAVVEHAADPDAAVDALIVAAAADLAILELTALSASPDRAQLVRTRAAVRVLARMPEMAPGCPLPEGGLTVLREALSHDGEPPEEVRQALSAILRDVRQPIRATVQFTLLPTTRLHDEQMFIRCIQIFEGIYAQIAEALIRAGDAVSAGKTDLACAEFDRASARLEATPVLYRVLTTMPKEVFAVIRDYTHGRSAVQSRQFRRVEAAGPDLLKNVETLGVSSDAMARLTQAMDRLNQAWRTMKISHWGITLKIIGSVPGTGGTTGAAYLRERADISLFPDLTA